MSEDITAAAEEQAPRRSKHLKVTPPWWTDELRDARKALRAAARRLHVTGDRQSFNVLRNVYTSILQKNKVGSWRRFCTMKGKQPWGRLYRWLKNGINKHTALGLMMRPDGSRCTTLDDSVETLLDALIPNDPQQQGQKENTRTVCDLQPIDKDQLKQFAWSISPSRAPGMDGITVKMVRAQWPCFSGRFLTLVNNCLREARFPTLWKSALVVPILKGEDRDVTLPKSYRPVSLLPVLGKILEKAMNMRLQEQIAVNLTGKLYGFTKDRFTMDAIDNLMTWSATRPEKYVITVFLDISGAFDNLA